MLVSPGQCLYKRRKFPVANLIFNIVLVVILVLLTAEILFTMRYTSIYVGGRSMLPTLTGAPYIDGTNNIGRGGDYVFVDVRDVPDYFDIVVVKANNVASGEHNIIKRVVAFGGDTVKLELGVLYLKKAGESEFLKVDEPYIAPENNSATNSWNTFGEHVVADGCMFLLGDNRNDSSDSRGAYGDFPLSELVGVVPGWSLKSKKTITAILTFFDFGLGLGGLKHVS